MKRNERLNLKQKGILIYQIAATYIGTVVGAGFATGQEIYQFFSRFGMYGYLGILLSTSLFIWFGYRIMDLSRRYDCYSYQEFHLLLFGEKIGALFNLILPLMLLGGSGVMLSGMGALFSEQFHLSKKMGILLTLLLVLLIVLMGMKGVLAMNAFFVPFILSLILFLSVQFFKPASPPLPAVDPEPGQAGIFPFWLAYAILYAGLNLVLSQAILVPIGKEVQKGTALFWGSLFGGGGLGVLLLIMQSLLLKFNGMVQQSEIPMGVLIGNLLPGLIPFFTIIVMLEILTTLVGNLYGILRQIESLSSIPRLPILILLLLGSFLISQWGFRSLVATLYPFIGALGVIYLLRILLFRPRQPFSTKEKPGKPPVL